MREFLKNSAIGVCAAVVLAALAVVANYPVNHAKGQGTFNGPNATSVALSTTSGQIVGINPSRKMITFCNPTAVVEYIAPAPLVPLTGGTVGIGLPAIASGVTSCYSTPLGLGNLGAAWNGVSASATPNITVLEFI